MAQKVDTQLVIEIIKLIQKNKRTSAARMAESLDVSAPTIRRTIVKAKELLGVEIKYVRSAEVDDPGWYEVHSYGVLDPSLFQT